MKRALVTGGCGFIGSNLTRELVSQGWVVDVVDDMSNGHLELLEGLKYRPLLNASFLAHFKSYYTQTHFNVANTRKTALIHAKSNFLQ